jgi:hypothetical protein
MSTTKTRKTFDCVQFKHKAQAEIYEDIKGLTPGQQIEYFDRKADQGPMGKWWRQVRSTTAAGRVSRRKR